MALFNTVALCDQAYCDRDTGKAILAGIFAGDILVAQFPSKIRMSVYAEFLPPQSGHHSVSIKIHVNRKKYAEAVLEAQDAVAGIPAILIVPNFELGIPEPATLEIRASVAGARDIVIIRKQIILGQRPPFAPPSLETAQEDGRR